MAKRLHGGCSDLKKSKYKSHEPKRIKNRDIRLARREREAIKNAQTFMRRGRVGRRIASGKRKVS